MEHLRPDPIDYSEREVSSVLGGIDMHAERSLAEGRINNRLEPSRPDFPTFQVGAKEGALARGAVPCHLPI